MEDDDGYTLVVRKQKPRQTHSRRSQKKQKPSARDEDTACASASASTSAGGNACLVPPEEYVETLLEPQRTVVRTSELCRNVQQQCETFLAYIHETRKVSLIGLGIGCFTQSEASSLQLALFLELKEHLQRLFRKEHEATGTQHVMCICSDPSFTDRERDLLGQLSVAACLSDSEFKVDTDTPIILFMPHCPAYLYGAMLERFLVRRNVDNGKMIQKMAPVSILGNSLLQYLRADEWVPRQRLPQGNQQLLDKLEQLGVRTEYCFDSVETMMNPHAAANVIRSDENMLPFSCHKLNVSSNSEQSQGSTSMDVAFSDFCFHCFHDIV